MSKLTQKRSAKAAKRHVSLNSAPRKRVQSLTPMMQGSGPSPVIRPVLDVKNDSAPAKPLREEECARVRPSGSAGAAAACAVDVKPDDAKSLSTDSYVSVGEDKPDFKMVRQMIAMSSVGKGHGRGGINHLRLNIPFTFSFTASATGVVLGVISIDADSNTTEWNGLLTLYDEYKVLGGRVLWTVPAMTALPTASGGLSADGCCAVLAYDPMYNNALSSTREALAYQYHDVRAASFVANPGLAVTPPTNATSEFGWQHANGKLYEFHFKPGPMALNSSAAGAIGSIAGQWTAMAAAGSNVPCGFLKAYTLLSPTGSTYDGIAGYVVMECEFRARV